MTYTEQYAIDMINLIGQSGSICIDIGIENHKIHFGEDVITKQNVLEFITKLEEVI